jgi:hypothetical protein
MEQEIIRKVFNTVVDEMNSNSSNKNFNEKENTEMKRLNLYESRLFGRICYGFGRDEEGYVFVKEEEASVVRKIFEMAINGNSLHAIQVELFNKGIKSPSGKDTWTRDVIDKTINNQKYVPHIIEFDNYFMARGEKELRCRYIRS